MPGNHLPKIALLVFLSAMITGPGCKNGPESVKPVGQDGGMIYRSGTAKRTDLPLPDGTQVRMNAGSVIRIPAGFNKINRDLFLEGEALFKISPHGFRPLVVHTKALVITEADSSMTLFKVIAFPDSAGEEVDLLTGRLIVRKSYHSGSDNEPVTLKAGEMVMINTDIDLMEEEKADSTELKNWIMDTGRMK